MEIRIERLDGMRVLAMRHVGPYSQVKFMWPKFMAHVAARGLTDGACQTIGLSYDDPDTTDQGTLRYDACIVSDAEGDGVVTPIVLEPGRWAIYRHLGEYELIGHWFDRLIDYLVLHQKHELRHAPCMEIYRNDPTLVAPAECITDLAVPIV